MSSRGSTDPWSSSPTSPWPRRLLALGLTLLVGIVVGAVATGYLTRGGGPLQLGSEPTPTVTVTSTAPPRTDAYVIPAECLALLQRSRTVTTLMARAATAAADVDAARLSGIVREMEAENDAMAGADAACRTGVSTPRAGASN